MSLMGYTIDEIVQLAEWPSLRLDKVFYCCQYRPDQSRYDLRPVWECPPHGKIIDRAEWWALRKQRVFGAPLDMPPTKQTDW